MRHHFSRGTPVPRFVASSKNQTAATTTLTLTVPSGRQSGDILIAAVGASGTVTYTAPWTERLDSQSRGVYTTVSGGTETSVVVTASGSTNLSGICLVYRYADFDVIGTVSGILLSPQAPEINITYDNSILIGIPGTTSASTSYTAPAGFSASIDSDSDATAPSWNCYPKLVNKGLTGIQTFTGSANTGRAYMFGLKPKYKL